MTEVVETAVEAAEPVVETVAEAGKKFGKAALGLAFAAGVATKTAFDKAMPKIKSAFRKSKKAKDQKLETAESAEGTEE